MSGVRSKEVAVTSRTLLVSTALEVTWPQDQPIVFLGSWCLRYSRKQVWSKLDYQVLPYPWEDRLALAKDFVHIEEMYEVLLPELAKELNRIHAVTHTIRYWRIVVGWWLFYFIQIFFDRWQVVVAADSGLENSSLLRVPPRSQFPASNDMASFIRDMTGDEWNERLFADMCQKYTNIHVTAILQDESVEMPRKHRVLDAVEQGGISAKRCFLGRVALHGDYLSRWEKAKLAFLLRQFPSKRPMVPVPVSEVNPAWREWNLQYPVDDRFSRALVEAIPRYLPLCYLEGYAESARRASTSYTVRRQKVIMTENSFATDDIWKMWTGAQCDGGAKLVVAQHGGNYGTGSWSASQTHELAISDRYLSWGWSDPKEPHVWAAPATRLVGEPRRTPRQRGNCLQVVTTVPRQSYWMFSAPVGPQLEKYLEDQLTFASALCPDVRGELVVRLDRHDYGWDQAERWHDAEPAIRVDVGIRPLSELLDDTRLYVATYNATTFLESFTQGIPTVMFWNPEYWELSEPAKPFFELLRDAQIFFEDPVTCASHVNSIWENVPEWWESSEVQEAVQSFRHQYAYVGPHPLRDLKRALTEW